MSSTGSERAALELGGANLGPSLYYNILCYL